MTMKDLISAVIPARNEEATVASVVHAICKHPAVARVIVVDNGSTDNTAKLAASAGALVVSESVPGKGRALKRGIAAADTSYILQTDADITNWNPSWVDLLYPPGQNCLTRGVFTSPYDQFPVTNLVLRPYLEMFAPALASLQTPFSGTCTYNVASVSWQNFPNDWTFEIALLIDAYESGLRINDVNLGILDDKQRDINYYVPMARDIHRYFINKYTQPKGMLRARPNRTLC